MKGVKVQSLRSLRKEMKAGVRRERPARGVSASSLPRTKETEATRPLWRTHGRGLGDASASGRTHHSALAPDTTPGFATSRQAFAYRLGVNTRTLERWEQGRSKPNDQAAALILLVRKYPDTLKRLDQLAAAG